MPGSNGRSALGPSVDDDPPALAEERRQRIAQAVASKGRVMVSELVRDLGVTGPTIRRDLDELQHRRVLRRTHGGAIAVQVGPGGTRNDSPTRRSEADERIAVAVLAHISPGMSIFLDGGSVFELIAERLQVWDVSILTNSLEVARLVAGRPGIRHTLVGGELHSTSGMLVGPIALENLGRFTFDLALIGAGGLVDGVVSVPDLGEAQVKRAAIDRARHVILALDSSACGRSEFVEVGRLNRFDLVITDSALPDAQAWCEAHGAALQVADWGVPTRPGRSPVPAAPGQGHCLVTDPRYGPAE